ncbi:MAG: sortase [Bacilli bacterium]|nr:sortase [Bacilli bacterium]
MKNKKKLFLILNLLIIALMLYNNLNNKQTNISHALTKQTITQNSSNNQLENEVKIMILNKEYSLFNDFSIQHLLDGYGKMPHSANYADIGQSIIGAHRESHGNILKHVKINDIITIKDHKKLIKYEVSSINIIDEKNANEFYLQNTRDNILTLFTCYPVDASDANPTKRLVINALKIN